MFILLIQLRKYKIRKLYWNNLSFIRTSCTFSRSSWRPTFCLGALGLLLRREETQNYSIYSLLWPRFAKRSINTTGQPWSILVDSSEKETNVLLTCFRAKPAHILFFRKSRSLNVPTEILKWWNWNYFRNKEFLMEMREVKGYKMLLK